MLPEPSLGPHSLIAAARALQAAATRDIEAHSRDEVLQADAIVSAVLIQLRSRLNRLSPADRLPPEILIHIFQEVVCGASLGGGRHLHLRYRRKRRVATRLLLTLTHVCRKWREVALNTSTFWTHIDDHKPQQLEAFVTRSGSVPLTLHVVEERMDRVGTFLNAHWHHVKRLDVTVLNPQGVYLPPLLSFQAPVLECLTIVSDGGVFPSGDGPPPMIFDQPVSGLKALAMVYVSSWIPANHFPRLTHLYLSRLCGRILVNDAMRSLYGLLSHTPALQYLHVSGLNRRSAVSDVHESVPLHALRAFTCTTSDFQAALRLLGLLQIPEETLVRLDRMECLSPNEVALPAPLPCQALLASLTRLEIATDCEELHLVAEGPRSGLWIQGESIEGDWTSWLRRLCRLFPLPSVTTLHVSCPEDPFHEIIANLIVQLPSLSTLGVRLEGASDAAAAEGQLPVGCLLLYNLFVHVNPPGRGPRLETLILQFDSVPPEEFDLDSIVDMLAERARMGYPLRHVVLSGDPLAPISWQADSVREQFTVPARGYVDTVDVLPDFCVLSFAMNEIWNVPEAERYWTLPEDEKASYELPFSRPQE